jgi:hypothetical protein
MVSLIVTLPAIRVLLPPGGERGGRALPASPPPNERARFLLTLHPRYLITTLKAMKDELFVILTRSEETDHARFAD